MMAVILAVIGTKMENRTLPRCVWCNQDAKKIIRGDYLCGYHAE